MQVAFEQDTNGSVLFRSISLRQTGEEVAEFLTHFRREIRRRDIHSYFKAESNLGRKPIKV